MADVTIEVPAELTGFIQYGIELHRQGADDDWRLTQRREDLESADSWGDLSQQARVVRPGGKLELSAEPSSLQRLAQTAMCDLTDELRATVETTDPSRDTISGLLAGLDWLLSTYEDLGAKAAQSIVDEAESATREAAG